MLTDLWSVLKAFRSDMLADVTRALSESPRRAKSGGQASEQGGTLQLGFPEIPLYGLLSDDRILDLIFSL